MRCAVETSDPMNPIDPVRIDRRVAIKWMLAAGAGAMFLRGRALGAAAAGPSRTSGGGYGTDPDLMKPYKPGDYWDLTFSDAQRRAVALLSDIVIPADSLSPSASSLGVTDFVDEWVSAPYPDNVRDRKVILDGLTWLEAESSRRFGSPFEGAGDAQRLALCEDMSAKAPEGSDLAPAHEFFHLFRDLVASGYYTTPEGLRDIGYAGNMPLAKFEGPPPELISKLVLADEVTW